MSEPYLQELHLIFSHYLRPNQLQRLLEEVKRTEAYRSNRTFRMTINHLSVSGPLHQPDATEVIFGDDD